MCDHNYSLWRWNPEAASIDPDWLREALSSVEVKDFSTEDSEIPHDKSTNVSDVLKEMQAITSNEIQPEKWIDPIPLDIP